MIDSSQNVHTGALASPAYNASSVGVKTREFNVAAHGLRGLAAMMVLGAHILGGTAANVLENNDVYAQLVLQPWNFGVFGVKLFFVISGFVILPSALKYGPREFALRRLFRIYPLFFAFTILFALLNYLTNKYPDLNNIESIVSAFLFLNLFTGTEQLTPNAWSLTYEVLFYALTCGVVYGFVKRPNPFLAGIAAVAAIAFLVAYPIALFFIAGVLVRLLGEKCPLPVLALRMLEGAFFILIVFSASRQLFGFYDWSDLRDPAATLSLICTAVYFYLAVDPRSLTTRLANNRAAIYTGTISYSIYLVHPYPYYVLRNVFDGFDWFQENMIGALISFSAAVIVLSIAISHYVHIALEKWPYQWFFRQRIYRSSTERKRVPAGADGQRRNG